MVGRLGPNLRPRQQIQNSRPGAPRSQARRGARDVSRTDGPDRAEQSDEFIGLLAHEVAQTRRASRFWTSIVKRGLRAIVFRTRRRHRARDSPIPRFWNGSNRGAGSQDLEAWLPVKPTIDTKRGVCRERRPPRDTPSTRAQVRTACAGYVKSWCMSRSFRKPPCCSPLQLAFLTKAEEGGSGPSGRPSHQPAALGSTPPSTASG